MNTSHNTLSPTREREDFQLTRWSSILKCHTETPFQHSRDLDKVQVNAWLWHKRWRFVYYMQYFVIFALASTTRERSARYARRNKTAPVACASKRNHLNPFTLNVMETETFVLYYWKGTCDTNLIRHKFLLYNPVVSLRTYHPWSVKQWRHDLESD